MPGKGSKKAQTGQKAEEDFTDTPADVQQTGTSQVPDNLDKRLEHIEAAFEALASRHEQERKPSPQPPAKKRMTRQAAARQKKDQE